LLEPIPRFGLGQGNSAGALHQSCERAAASGADALAHVRDAPSDRPFVVAQLGQSLDGRIATITGESRWINGAAALDHVHALRACVDGVVVGVGTAIADNPMLTVRRVVGTHPTRVVIDPNGRLPDCARLLNDDGVRRIVVRGESAPAAQGAETLFVARERDQLCPRKIVRELFQQGLRRILVEGGARTISSFIDADVVDRLHILVAPVIIGSGKPGLELAPIERLANARRPDTVVHVLEGGEVLFDCNLRQSCA
jgi:diaminohydroxyphosphoribosylaminopyrimidine deaminase/5-amino-6-(5-phosphoribosylamino)uracil reductase